MRKAILLIAIVVFMVNTASAIEITQGVTPEMNFQDVSDTLQGERVLYNDTIYAEGTVEGQPFTAMLFCFVDSLDDIKMDYPVRDVDKQSTDSKIVGTLLLERSMCELSWQLAHWDTIASNPNKELAQVYCEISSDRKYIDAQETFEDIEKVLTEKYGETRFTSRRGTSLPMVCTEPASYFFVSLEDIDNASYKAQHELAQYAQRVIQISTNRYLVIDHHIEFLEEKGNKGFLHRLVYSVVPEDISGGYYTVVNN